MEHYPVDEAAILSSLRRISRAIDIHSRRLVKEHLLTTPQLICLRALSAGGPMMPSELAREISLSQATVTGILDRLSERRLVSRRRNPRDKRCVVVRVTDRGREALAAAPSPLQGGFAQTFAMLDVGQRERIAAVLAEVASRMETPLEAAEMALQGAASRRSAASRAPLRGCFFGRRGLFGQQLERFVHRDCFRRRVLREGRVDLAVLHVGAVAARHHDNRLSVGRVGAELAQRLHFGAGTASPAAGCLLGEELQRAVELDGEDVVAGLQGGVGLALHHIGAELSETGLHHLAG